VNPVVEKHKDRLKDLPEFFKAHTNMMNYYNVDYAVMNEYFVRAYSVIFMRKFKADFPGFDEAANIERHKQWFIYIDEFIKRLEEYERCVLSFEEFYLSKLDEIILLK